MKYNTINEALEAFIKLLIENKKYKLSSESSANNYDSNIYNEFSLQHELGIFLKQNMDGYIQVFFEKNVYEKIEDEYKAENYWVKKEVDLIVLKYKDKECTQVEQKYAIELKFKKGKNARTPENMFDFLRDIRFMEQIQEYKKFDKSFVFIIVDAEKYYYNQGNHNDIKTKWIYDIFRKEKNKDVDLDIDEIEVNIPGGTLYTHPTGKPKKKKNTENRDAFTLNNSYNTSWKKIKDKYKYIFIEI